MMRPLRFFSPVLIFLLPASAQQILTAVSTPTHALVHGNNAVYQDYSGSTAILTRIDLDTKAKTILLPQGAGGSQPYHYEYSRSGDDLVYVPFSTATTYPLNYRNVATGATRLISTNQGWKETVWVGGGMAVWVDYRHKLTSNQNSEIYMAPAAAGAEQRLTNDTRYQTKPVTDGQRVAWLDYVAGTHANVVLYTLAGGATLTPSPSARHQDNPRLSGDYLIWEDYRNATTDSTNADIYAYHIPTAQVIPLCTAAGFQGNPFLQGTGAVWEDYRNISAGPNNVDLYGYNLSTNIETAISTRIGYEAFPVHHGNRIVWFQIDGSAMNLYTGTVSFGTTAIRLPAIGPRDPFLLSPSGRRYRANGGTFRTFPDGKPPTETPSSAGREPACRACLIAP